MACSSKASVMVYNIPWSVGQQELHTYFTKFGLVKSAKILINKKTGFSKHYGVVTFHEETAVAKATTHKDHILESYKLMVTPCNLQILQLIKTSYHIE